LAAANIAAGMNPLGVLSLQNGLVDDILRAAMFAAAKVLGAFARMRTQSAPGGETPNASGWKVAPPTSTPDLRSFARSTLRAMTATRVTCERRSANVRPSAPGPMTAIG
jgi:hypothetical protein